VFANIAKVFRTDTRSDHSAGVLITVFQINSTSDDVLQHNWYDSGIAQAPNSAQHNNQLIGNIQDSAIAVSPMFVTSATTNAR